MERIVNQKHKRETFLYATSRMFERMGYYGIRSIVLLYMIGDTFDISQEDAIFIYGSMGTVILVFQIIGGFLGDLVIGNKKSIIIGGLM